MLCTVLPARRTRKGVGSLSHYHSGLASPRSARETHPHDGGGGSGAHLPGFPHFPRKQLVNERLIGNAALGCERLHPPQHPHIEPNRNEPSWFLPQGRPPHTAHGGQLLLGQWRNVRIVNPPFLGSPFFLFGSPAAH